VSTTCSSRDARRGHEVHIFIVLVAVEWLNGSAQHSHAYTHVSPTRFVGSAAAYATSLACVNRTRSTEPYGREGDQETNRCTLECMIKAMALTEMKEASTSLFTNASAAAAAGSACT
jgi:hypothetical protein